ncbi:Uncharacterised protein [Chlamydia trachomatis]|nr:Uncharacterised protein [Chlamydia trachomatis]
MKSCRFSPHKTSSSKEAFSLLAKESNTETSKRDMTKKGVFSLPLPWNKIAMQSSKLKSPYLQKTLCYSSVFFLNNEENNARKEKRETSHPIAEMLSVKGNFLGHTRT